MSQGKKKKTIQSLDEAYFDAFHDEKAAGDSFTVNGLDLDLTEEEPVTGELEPEIIQEQNIEPVFPPEDERLGYEYNVSEDRLSVTLLVQGHSSLSIEKINADLEKIGVKHGIDREALSEVEKLTQSPEWRGEIVVARGTSPDVDRTVHYLTVEDGEINSLKLLVDHFNNDFRVLKDILTARVFISVANAALVVRAVAHGEQIIRIDENPDAKAGKTVFGEDVDIIKTPLPQFGDNIEFNDQTSTYKAKVYGYLHVENEKISVLPPVWVSPDNLEALYVNLPQIGTPKYPSLQDVHKILDCMDIIPECRNVLILVEICEKFRQGIDIARATKIAAAIPPKNGADAQFRLAVDAEIKAGTFRDDGSVDLRERNAVVSVSKGVKIAVKKMATKGIPGLTIFGKNIPAVHGNDKRITVMSGVEVKKMGDAIIYLAKRDGNVKYSNFSLSVVEIHNQAGDVDYAVGNLDLNTDLIISGSVLAGFKVKSTGNISIYGSVEEGAQIIAGGNLTIDKGIIGKKTKVIVKGNLRTGFIQDAEVIVQGYAVINSYLFNCLLRANGSVSVLKEHGKKSGKVVGGIICSSKDIQLSSLGNPNATVTIVAILPNPELSAQLRKIEEEIDICKSNISKISRTLPFDSFDPSVIKAVTQKLDPAKRKIVFTLLSNLNTIMKQLKERVSQKELINKKIEFDINNASIRVTNEVFPGCEMQFGEKKFITYTEMGPSVFQLKEGQIVY